jgi:hypothetical protein
VIAAVALVIGVSLVLEVTDSGGPEVRRPASLTEAQVERIAKRVERIRGLRFVRPVKPLFVDREEAVRIVNEATSREYSRGEQRSDEESLKLLGLMRPTESLSDALAAVGSEQILGFYDDRSKRLVVVREQGAGRALLEITLAHELVHALEDQRFGFRTGGGLTDDRTISESALAEGTATEVMVVYARRFFDAGDALSVLAAASRSSEKLPAYVEASLLFPYEAGLEFVERLKGDSGSWRVIDRVLRMRRPSSAEQVLHLDKYAAGERPEPIRVPNLGSELGPGWRRAGASSVGEFDLRALFEIVGGSLDDAAAAGWGGGAFELWRKEDGRRCTSPCIARDVGVMRIAWDTETDRAIAGEVLGKAFEKGLEAKPLGSAVGVRLWSSRGGALAMAAAGRRIDLVLAPDASFAARVLARVGSRPG